MKKKWSVTSVFVLASIIVYILACFLPAYTELYEPYKEACYRESSGFWCLFYGAFFIIPITLFGLLNPEDNWVLIWYANVFYVIAIYRLLNHYKHLKTIIYAFLAVLIGVFFSYVDTFYVVQDGTFETSCLQPGYFFWELSFIVVLVVSVWNGVQEFYNKKEIARMYVLSSLSILFVCIALVICYTHVFQGKTNNIAFDEDKQCIITEEYCKRIIIYDEITENTDTLHRARHEKRKKELNLNEIQDYFISLRPLKSNQNYIITNISYPNKKFEKIRIHINKDGHAKIASTE